MGMIRDRIARMRAPAPPHAIAPARVGTLGAPRTIGGVDPILLGLVIALIAFGVVMVFSASSVLAAQRYHDPHYFLVRQCIFAGAGIPLMLLVSRIDYHLLRPLTYPVLLISTVLLTYIALGFGHTAGGAARWIPIGPFHVQPAEMAKVAMILWLAYSLSKKQEAIRTFKVGILPHLLVAIVLGLLCLRQPDFGSAMMIALLTFVLLFAAGAKIGPLASLSLAGAAIAALLVWTSPMRLRRVMSFLDPFGHRRDEGYQVAESIIAYGSGGLSGVGIGDSRQRLGFLPEAHTDFIGAIVGEELGFVGVAILVIAYAVIVVRGVRASFRAADDYGTFLAIGITLFVGAQAFTNLAVTMGMVPTKGLVLPFMSYGGSSLLVNAAAFGILLNVSRPREGDAAANTKVSATASSGGRASAPRLSISGVRASEGGAA